MHGLQLAVIDGTRMEMGRFVEESLDLLQCFGFLTIFRFDSSMIFYRLCITFHRSYFIGFPEYSVSFLG